MAIRTTKDLVIKVLMDDYGERLCGGNPDLSPFISAANNLVGQIDACVTRNNKTALTTSQKREVETWLAAHFYQMSDPGYTSKSTAGASASFTGQFGMYLEMTRYGQTAMLLDPSGCLRMINKGSRVRMDWLGKPPSEQIPIEQRD